MARVQTGKSKISGYSYAWLLMRNILGKSERGNQFDDIARLTGLAVVQSVSVCYNSTPYILIPLSQAVN